MRINKLMTTLEEQAQMEYTEAIAAQQKAMIDYNVMMGNLDDPTEEDEEDE